MSTWEDAKGRRHAGVMVGGKRVHRILPKGATSGDAKRLDGELRAAASKAAKSSQRVSLMPGDIPMTKVVELYVEHAASLRSAVTSIHHANRVGLWAEKYTASQAAEFADHVMKDLRALVPDKKGVMKPAYAQATISRSLAAVKKGLKIAWKKKLTPENYGLHITPPEVHNKREVFLSVAQVRTIADCCSVRAQAAIWAALLTGARRGEIFRIRKEDIRDNEIHIPASHTKVYKSRVIPIIPALRPWLVHFPLTMKVSGVKSAWRRGRVKADMEHVNFHDLRHSCASIMLSLGVDLYTIGKILGHSNVQTTQRYAHLQIEQQRAALNKLGALVNSG